MVCLRNPGHTFQAGCGQGFDEYAGWRKAQLCGQLAITLKKLGAAIGAGCEELQVSGHKMGFVGGYDLR